MTTIAGMGEHGSYVPGREVQIYHQPQNERMLIYIKLGVFADGWRLYALRPEGDGPYIADIAPGIEPPIYLVIGAQEAEAISEALHPKQEASARHLDDAIDVRDRLLYLVEKLNGVPAMRREP